MAVKRCRRSRKTGFQHVQESGSSTAGNHVMASRRTTHHTIHRRLDSGLEFRVNMVRKRRKRRFFFLKQKTSCDFMPGLVGSELCIRSRPRRSPPVRPLCGHA
ncbi:hypothetical protein FG733_24435, partial [Salmonella enterica subsp. enterica serovar Derby]